ncbi:MAG: aspartate-semialdehyde dehydrogenase [Spirochaetes bacterium]|nr:aspartate-semialdehyde dehydrogenase [Spirochaetota bacterium]
MSKKVNVAVVGATGAVGEEMLATLDKRNFPVGELFLYASSRSKGKTMMYRGKEYKVEELTHDCFKGRNINVALFSAGSGRSKEFAADAVLAGAVVVDNSSAFRMTPDVPLVVPEINPEDIKKHKGIIANPNCSTIIMLMPLWPLHQKNRIKRIVVSTYQAASGAGAQAMAELEEQTRDVLAGKPAVPKIMPHRYAFNLFSHNTAIQENGYNEEENKMVKETWKIFHDDTIKVCPTCVRVPVLRAHSESIVVEFEKPMSVDEARKLLAKAPGVKLIDDRAKNMFPMPIDATGQYDCLVGRIREDISSTNSLALFVAGDQLLKGAALNAVQIAELL